MSVQNIPSSKRLSPPIPIVSKKKQNEEESEPTQFYPDAFFLNRMRDYHLGSKHRVADLFAREHADKEYKAVEKTRTHEVIAEVFISASHELVRIIVAYSFTAKKP
ncbi:MAG TPA: hypothetical protein VLG44_00185 [Chlamydiales bacterium]|nr:hypothetical protein [Chlamydiales bacterium]